MTLYERLLAEIERREKVARLVTEEYGTDAAWRMHVEDPWTKIGGHAPMDFVELHSPADALRRYARDRKVLERHERDHIYDEYVWSCVRCTDGDLVAVEWPCDDIRDLAESLGVPIEEA